MEVAQGDAVERRERRPGRPHVGRRAADRGGRLHRGRDLPCLVPHRRRHAGAGGRVPRCRPVPMTCFLQSATPARGRHPGAGHGRDGHHRALLGPLSRPLAPAGPSTARPLTARRAHGGRTCRAARPARSRFDVTTITRNGRPQMSSETLSNLSREDRTLRAARPTWPPTPTSRRRPTPAPTPTARPSGPPPPSGSTGARSGTRSSTGRTRRSRSGSSAAPSTPRSTAWTATSRPATATRSRSTGWASPTTTPATSPTPSSRTRSRRPPTR